MKVCVGLSGGVDSSVAALLLKQQGYDVFAMFMQNWHDADPTLHGDCEWEEDRFVAELVARKIGIPFYFVDLSGPYRKKVVDYMFDEYSKGRTPNPDVLCNREIKFDAFMEVARKYGADMVATGHYCRKEPVLDENGNPVAGPDGRPLFSLLEGTDPNKDQSYFLCQLSQEQIAAAMFPIGDIPKKEVRRIAAEADLPSADKKDSQGICFVGKVDLPTFLRQKLESKEGPVVEVYGQYYADNERYQSSKAMLTSLLRDPSSPLSMELPFSPEAKVLTSDGEPLGESPFDEEKVASLSDAALMELSDPLRYDDIRFETEVYRSGRKRVRKTRYKDNPYGKILGSHEGAHFFTIGQRKGLNIGGHTEPLFVISTDTESNVLYVGEGFSHPGLFRRCLRIAEDEIHLIDPLSAMQCGETRRLRVRIRYRQPLQGATLIRRKGWLFILFDKPQRSITAGQFAVWYNGDKMLGSGVISV